MVPIVVIIITFVAGYTYLLVTTLMNRDSVIRLQHRTDTKCDKTVLTIWNWYEIVVFASDVLKVATSVPVTYLKNETQGAMGVMIVSMTWRPRGLSALLLAH